MVFNMVAPKIIWKKLNFWNESYMVNLKPISNTLKMDFNLLVLVHFNMLSALMFGPNNHTELMWQ
jgi:hypothetical protein